MGSDPRPRDERNEHPNRDPQLRRSRRGLRPCRSLAERFGNCDIQNAQPERPPTPRVLPDLDRRARFDRLERRGPGMIFAKAAAVLKKDILTSVRYRSGFFFKLASPALQLATFYYLARAVGPQFRPDGMPYAVFLIVGTGFYTFLVAGIHSFLQAIQDSQRTGTLEVLLTTSTPPPTLLLLSTLSSFAGNLLQFVVYVGSGILLFAPAVNISVSAAAAVLVLSVLVAIAIGLFAAGLQVSIHKGSAVLWLLGSCAWLMAGTLFPVAALPRPLQLVSALIPFTHSLTAMRLAMFQASNSAALVRELEVLFLFSLLLLPLSIGFFSWTVRRARQCGSLSFY